MTTQELLIEEISRQPESVQREVLHFLRFLVQQREEAQWSDVLPERQVEQEVLDILSDRSRAHHNAESRRPAGGRGGASRFS